MIRIQGVAFATLLLSLQCAAQSPAELLQKGIYMQETAGDLDAAIQIYRQITATAGQSPVAAQAQYRTAMTMLQKGDLNGASVEFSVLATKYPESQALIAKAAGRMSLTTPHQSTGTVQNGQYRDNRSGLEFALPASWTIKYDQPSSDDGNIVGLSEPGSNVDYAVWMKPEVLTPAEIPDRLRGAVPEKVKMNSNRPGFAFRPESIQPRVVGRQHALSGVADYVENGQKLVAYYVWVYTEKTRSVFIARDIPAGDFASVQPRLDSLVSTAKVP
jgi:hypothetical protein